MHFPLNNSSNRKQFTFFLVFFTWEFFFLLHTYVSLSICHSHIFYAFWKRELAAELKHSKHNIRAFPINKQSFRWDEWLNVDKGLHWKRLKGKLITVTCIWERHTHQQHALFIHPIQPIIICLRIFLQIPPSILFRHLLPPSHI